MNDPYAFGVTVVVPLDVVEVAEVHGSNLAVFKVLLIVAVSLKEPLCFQLLLFLLTSI